MVKNLDILQSAIINSVHAVELFSSVAVAGLCCALFEA